MPTIALPLVLLGLAAACAPMPMTPTEREDARLERVAEDSAADAMDGVDPSIFDSLE